MGIWGCKQGKVLRLPPAGRFFFNVVVFLQLEWGVWSGHGGGLRCRSGGLSKAVLLPYLLWMGGGWEDGVLTSWGQLWVCKSQATRPHLQRDGGEGVRTDDVINSGFPGPSPMSAARLLQRSWVAGRWDISRRSGFLARPLLARGCL